MWLSIILAQLGLSSLYNHSLATLVENLRCTGEQAVAFERAVKAYAYEARCQIRCTTQQPPRNATRLIVEGCMKVPSAGCLILERSGRGAAASLRPFFAGIGIRANHLN